MTSRALGNGLTQTYDYYDWNEQVNGFGQGGRLQNLTTGSLQNLTYTYDPVGNIMQIVNLDSINPETNAYTYDELDRLESWTLNGGTPETYSYDSAGNLDVKAGVDLTYDDAAHVHAVSSTDNGTLSMPSDDNSYGYDANGNMITRDINSGTLAGDYILSYDAENRLVNVTKDGTNIASFVYDGDGKRIKSVIGSETTLFVGSHYEVTDGTVTKYYFTGATRIAMRKGGTLSYLLGDHLGSTSLTTDSTGNLVSELRYKPWGETRYAGGTTATKYQYTSQYSYESDFGLYFYQSRFYDPSLGRFSQPDSIIPEQSQGVQAWDRYAYTNNNPLLYTDPSGHCIICIAVGIAILAAATSPIWQPQIEQLRQPRIQNDPNGSGCTNSLTSCYQQGILAELESGHVEEDEFNQLMETVATDMEEGMVLPNPVGGLLTGRDTFDTPFYNGGGRGGLENPPYESSQTVCIGDQGCWERSDINYFAQGMWSAESGESLETALWTTEQWNSTSYSLSSPDIQGKLYWTQYGYLWYKNWQGWGDDWREHWKPPTSSNGAVPQ
jgi:RHS repeat-associated protein